MRLRQLLITATTALMIVYGSSSSAGWWPFGKDDKGSANEQELTELTWEDLIPDDFVQPENPFLSLSQEEIDKLMDGSPESVAEVERLQEIYNYAPVVGELDGKRVKLPAYVTPLEFDGQTKMSEFLLVPYVGACIHVPPPPANQVVHANSESTIEIKSMYDAVWAVGTLRTETVKSDLAEAGYRIEIEEVLPYSQ